MGIPTPKKTKEWRLLCPPSRGPHVLMAGAAGEQGQMFLGSLGCEEQLCCSALGGVLLLPGLRTGATAAAGQGQMPVRERQPWDISCWGLVSRNPHSHCKQPDVQGAAAKCKSPPDLSRNVLLKSQSHAFWQMWHCEATNCISLSCTRGLHTSNNLILTKGRKPSYKVAERKGAKSLRMIFSENPIMEALNTIP
jgi:hypothetical protein